MTLPIFPTPFLAAVGPVPFVTAWEFPSGNSDPQINWNNETNAYADDGSYANLLEFDVSQYSSELWLTNFGISLPGSSPIIHGVEVKLSTQAEMGEGSGWVRAKIAGSFGIGSDVYFETSFYNEDIQLLGGPTDLWGESALTKADVESSTFGVRVAFEEPSPFSYTSGRVYYAQVRIHGEA